jgi:hypothetical protein
MAFYILVFIAGFGLFASQASLNGISHPTGIGAALLLVALLLRTARVRVVIYRDRVHFRNLFRSGTVLRGARIAKRRNFVGAAGARGYKVELPNGRWIGTDGLLRYLGKADVLGAVEKALRVNFGSLY